MAGDVAVAAAVRGEVDDVVANEIAVVLADATAVVEVVARQRAVVAIGAALVAIRAVVAIAGGTAGTASLARMATREHSRDGDEDDSEECLHRETDIILHTSSVKDDRTRQTGRVFASAASGR